MVGTPRAAWGWLAAALLIGSPLFAQDESATVSSDTAATGDADVVDEGSAEPAGGEDLDGIEDILEGDEELLAGGGDSYDAAGRRDPFRSLLQRSTDEAERVRPAGVPGLLIDEIDIKGIFELDGRWFSQVQTADKEKSYLIEVGDQLFDGEVVSIVMNEIVFKQVVNDPSIIKPFREVVKKLNPEP